MNPTDCPSNPVSTSNQITRRSFMKKSALTAGAVTLLGQGVGFADPESSTLNTWWIKFRVKKPDNNNADFYVVDGDPSDNVDEVIAKAVKLRSTATETASGQSLQGVEFDKLKQQGGTVVNPRRFSPITQLQPPTYNSTTKQWRVVFPDNFEYKVTFRE